MFHLKTSDKFRKTTNKTVIFFILSIKHFSRNSGLYFHIFSLGVIEEELSWRYLSGTEEINRWIKEWAYEGILRKIVTILIISNSFWKSLCKYLPKGSRVDFSNIFLKILKKRIVFPINWKMLLSQYTGFLPLLKYYFTISSTNCSEYSF